MLLRKAMNQKRDAKNENHRRNEQRRFDSKVDRIFSPWRDVLDNSGRYAVQQKALAIAAEQSTTG